MSGLSSADHSVSPPRVEIPRDFNAAHDLIERNLRAGRSGKTAFIDDTGSFSYGQLAERVNRAGNALQGLGLELEDRIMLAHLDTVDFPSVFLGAIKAGIVPIAGNTLLTTADYEFMLNDSRAKVLVVSEQLLPTFAPLLEQAANKLPFLRHVIVSGRRRTSACADHLRRRLLLAVLLRLHRHAQRHGAHALAPDPDG